MKSKTFLTLFFIAMSSFMAGHGIALSLQTKWVKNNETVTADISQDDKTRIFVDGDRIKSIHGTANAYFYQNDDVKGQVYITPTPAFQKKPFNLFITTELGRTFGLQVTPKEASAESVMLKMKGMENKEKKALHWEMASGYNETIVKLIRFMARDDHPDGYEVIRFTKPISFTVGKVATLKLLKIYKGIHLKGEVYELQNRSNKPIKITESIFSRNGIRAVAIEEHVVPAHSLTRVYGVTSNG